MSEQITNHKDNFFQHLNKLRMQNLLCDVYFNVNGEKFSCHRVILAAVSPYFSTMFNGNFKESNSDVITIHDVETEVFDEILNALYTADIRLLPSNAYCILKTSHMMQLESIKDACVSYILNNQKISYLVDTCLFALSIGKMELHLKCVQTIRNDLLTYGQTECFQKIPIEIFRSILSSRNFNDSEEEAVFLLISQWSKDNNANCNDVQSLLESADLKMSKNVRPFIMADLMVNSVSNGSSLNEKCVKIIKEYEANFDFGLNVYFNGIDTKTCEKGWGILKMSDDFDNFILSSFHPADSHYRKVTRVGSKIYCLESTAEKNCFFCYSQDDLNDDKILLKTLPFRFKSFDLVSMGNVVYVMKNESESSNNCILAYDCERNSWETIFISFAPSAPNLRNSNGIRRMPTSFGSMPKSDQFAFPDFLGYNFSSLTCTGGILYLIANKSGEGNSYITSLDIRSPNAQVMGVVKFDQDLHVNAAVCAFDKKIAISGSNDRDVLYNSFSIFDITAKRWLYDVKPMNIARAHHNLAYRNGFIYAVENNKPFVTNEKYDLKSNKWITIAALPRRIGVECSNGIVTVSTGRVFGIDV